MATLKTQQKHRIDATPDQAVGGNTTGEVSTTVTGNIDKQTITVEDNYGSAVVWTSSGPITEFDFLAVESDVDVFVEFTLDQSGNPTVMQKVKAGLPYYIHSPDMGYNSSTRAGQGDNTDGTHFGQPTSIAIIRDEAEGAGDATVTVTIVT